MHYHTEIWVFICFRIIYIFSHISQASLPLPVIFLQSSLLIHFCRYFLHVSASSAVFLFAVLLCSLQAISDISYATLQDLSHDQFGDHSYLGSISIQKFFSSAASYILGKAAAITNSPSFHGSWKLPTSIQYFTMDWKYSCCLIDLERFYFILNH